MRTPKAAVVIAQTLRGLVVNGQLKEGDFLPNEAHLMEQYGVGRSTLREAVRLLEAERLLEVRRGARTGAKIRIPGPESLARPAGLLLQISGATFADVMAARCGIEPMAVYLLARTSTPRDVYELEHILTADIPAAREVGRLPDAVAMFHLRLVELSGNATLTLMAKMLVEITERHGASPMPRGPRLSQSDYDELLATYRQLLELVRAGDAEAAEAHWRRHMVIGVASMAHDVAGRRVRDLVY
ncbi:FadR/GntR family transcriptional regulator [Mycolicibacterium hodleri]|uniref:FadR/GntR family transcriptional regulator n=1 Tax=Mycolicibacterium hodleri TaxID=49897 RepID=UPI001F2C3A73|nr:FCD domain-containing protein [Mycolicibacterium hodleri]